MDSVAVHVERQSLWIRWQKTSSGLKVSTHALIGAHCFLAHVHTKGHIKVVSVAQGAHRE